jgi:hypothetical protein
MLVLGAMALLAGPTVRIGNLFLSAPNGIAFVWGPKAAAVFDLGGEAVAGIAAPDDSYHRQEVVVGGQKVTFEWGRVGDAAVGQFSSMAPVHVTLSLRETWPGVTTRYEPTPTGFLAWSGGHKASFELNPPPAAANSQSVEFELGPNKPAVFRFGESGRPDQAQIENHLRRAKEAYEAASPNSTGSWGDFLGAIPANLNNTRLYASDEDRVAHTVSRGWASRGLPNEAPYFCWDSFFNGNLASLDDPKTARETVRAILSWQTPEGLVPNYGHWLQSDGQRASNDRSQPPVGSLCVWKMEQRWPDKAFLKEVYPKLVRWHDWWPKYRDGDHDGLLEWGSGSAGHPGVGKQGALWETGWDDTPEYADSEMVGTTLDTDAVDLNALWAMDAENLAYIADAVGDHQEAAKLRAERLHTITLINSRLWNQELGIYCSRKWDSRGGAFLTRLTPMNFYPLICGAASPEQARSVLAVMTDPKRFWGQWVLPTLPFDDPLWPQQGYWHGTVWAPVNYLVFQGLQRYASGPLLAEYGAKSVRLFMRNWLARGQCGENFSSQTGLVNGDPHYTWGALLCLVGVESVCFVRPDGKVVLNGAQTATMTLRNVPIHGWRYTVTTGPGWARLSLGERVVGEAHASRVTLSP